MNGGPVQRRKAHRERRPQHFRYGRLIPAADGLRPGAQPSLESVQHFLERGGGLRHGGACRRRFRKGVQHHKIMMRVVVTHAGHMHSGLDQLAGVGLASSRSTSFSAVMIMAGGSPASCSGVALNGEAVISPRRRASGA